MLVLELDLTTVATPQELHRLLAAKLAFPAYYGNNWDAFDECVVSEDQSSLPNVLRVHGWHTMRDRLPRDAEIMRDCLDRLASERPECRVEWVS